MTQYLIAKPLAEKAGERRLLSLIYLNIGYLSYPDIGRHIYKLINVLLL